jgi:hypothetical protein
LACDTRRVHPVEDEEYRAELERAYRGVGWGCVLFIVGLLLVAIALLVLGSFVGNLDPLRR